MRFPLVLKVFNTEEKCEQEDKTALEQKIGEMESRFEKLEEELREVVALEITLYSVVSEHSSSAHKLHTPASAFLDCTLDFGMDIRKMVDKQGKDKINDRSSVMESEPKEALEEESDIETIDDSFSSQGDP
ncbi:hypothetical protein BC332_23585 [Capsicum chinense]|nr:hypothetical protein BC332_23585 [Capsicum chinense]